MKKRILQNISNTFHPLLSMVWATLLLLNFTPLIILPFWSKMLVLGEAILFTTVCPILVILLLYKLNRIEDLALSNRKDRAIPLVAQVVFMAILTSLLMFQGLPLWAVRFYKAGTFLLIAAMLISYFWKISGHAMGNAAIATAAFILYCRYLLIMPFIVPIGLLVILGLVGSIRLYLNRHTLAQVAVGALVGCLCMLTAI